jgi:hypothetical protein
VAAVAFFTALLRCNVTQQEKKKEKGDGSHTTIALYVALQCCSTAQQEKKGRRRRQPLLPSPFSLHCSAARKKE